MALKDIWKDRQDGIDDIMADDINSIAKAVIALEDEIKNVDIEVDDELSHESQKPVQNKVITAEIDSIKQTINGVEEELQMINEGGVE